MICCLNLKLIEAKGQKITKINKHSRLWCEKAPTIDCGEDIAKWISSVMLSKDSGMRVGFWSDSIKTRRNVIPSKLAKLYTKLRNEDTVSSIFKY